MKSLSPLYHSLITEAFGDDQRPAYGQVATLRGKYPTLRTVHLHYLGSLAPWARDDTSDIIAFSTHIQSGKWKELKKHPYLLACYYDTFRDIQFRFQSKAELIEPKNKELLDTMWLKIRTEVRTAYWLDAKHLPLDSEPPANIDVQKRAPNLGVVLCRPFLWDIYEIHLEDYRKGKRSIHTLIKGKWRSQEVSILHR